MHNLLSCLRSDGESRRRRRWQADKEQRANFVWRIPWLQVRLIMVSISAQFAVNQSVLIRHMTKSAILRDLERRIAEWTHLPVENGESFYLLRYNVGEKYVPHYDFFGGSCPCNLMRLLSLMSCC
jgi:hypothetical protein